MKVLGSRLPDLPIGEKLGLGVLFFACFTGTLAAANRFVSGPFSWSVDRATLVLPKQRKGFGIKHLVLLLIALLPGGLVASFTVYAIMGKGNWRRDSVFVLGLASLPSALLLSARTEHFPWPELSDAIYFSGLLGLIFGMLHLWILIKLLRQWWGEPDECVPFWPPLALLLQWALLLTAGVGILGA